MTRVFGELELRYLQEVLESGQLGWREGGKVTALDEAFARKVGARYGICRNSAMTALAQAVSLSGAGTGSEVICDPIVHFGGVAALYFNAVPRFADVRPDTYLMDPASLRANISPHTKAVIVTNLWGLCAELDEIRAICDAHGLFLIEDCAHNIGSYWKGRHAGTYGDLSCFSFQQSKHLCTGDGCVMVTDREDLHHKLYNEFAFSGESPAFLTLNFRMNELTAAVGLAQLERVDGYIAEYTASLNLYNEAIAGCDWLQARHVPQEAVQSGYIWACTWQGDRQGMDYARFKQVAQEMEAPLRFGFNQKPAYAFEIFSGSSAYHVPDCPVRCPFYQGDYRYEAGLCPNAEDLMPRLVMSGLVEVPPETAKRRAELIRKVIEVTERG
ncbi:MAG: DegT/DnrJ/EryC1/StrS family aminotransferase [Anaerolineae bacterium]